MSGQMLKFEASANHGQILAKGWSTYSDYISLFLTKEQKIPVYFMRMFDVFNWLSHGFIVTTLFSNIVKDKLF